MTSIENSVMLLIYDLFIIKTFSWETFWFAFYQSQVILSSLPTEELTAGILFWFCSFYFSSWLSAKQVITIVHKTLPDVTG